MFTKIVERIHIYSFRIWFDNVWFKKVLSTFQSIIFSFWGDKRPVTQLKQRWHIIQIINASHSLSVCEERIFISELQTKIFFTEE